MKLPFKRDAAAGLAKVRAAATACEAKLSELGQRRAELLSTGAELDELRQLDAAIERELRDQRIFADQITSLTAAVARLELERRSAAKLAAVGVLEGLFVAQLGKAVEVEKALARLSETYAEYEQARHRAWQAPWDDSLFPDTSSKYSPFRRDAVGAVFDSRISDLLGITRGTTSSRLIELAKRSAGMHKELASFIESYIADLRAAPLPVLFVDEQDAVA